MRLERWRLVSIALVALLVAFVATKVRTQSDITHFLPRGDADLELDLAREIVSGELSRTLVLLIEADDVDTALSASREFESALRAHPECAPRIAFLDAGPPEGAEEALWRLYFPRRFFFAGRTPDEVLERCSDAGLDAAVARLRDKLSSPMSGVVSRLAPDDPLLILLDFFEALQSSGREGLAVKDGRFVTEDELGAVLFLGSRASAMDSVSSRLLLEGVRDAFRTTRAAVAGPLRLRISGAHPHAAATEDAMRSDVRTVSIGSAIGLLVLMLAFFRSLRLFAYVVPVAATGFLAGTAACLALYGSIHALTLAFGAAMVGVSTDFAVHFHCHHSMTGLADDGRSTLRAIWKGLALSAGTTAASFLAQFAGEFPGLQELAVFGAVGITAAFAAACAFLPPLAARTKPTRLAERLADLLDVAAQPPPSPSRSWRMLRALPAALVALVACIGIPRVRWNDSLGALHRVDATAAADDEAVRARVVRYDQRRMVAAVAPDEQGALAVNDRVYEALTDLHASGALEGFRSLSELLPGAATQTRSDETFRSREGLWPALRTRLESAGFAVGAFEPFAAALTAAPPPPITFEDLADSPLAPLVRPFRITFDGRVAILSFVHGLADEAALRTMLSAIPGAQLIDVESVLGARYSAYRKRMAQLLGFGGVAIALLVLLRYRAVRPTLIAITPATLGACGTLGLLGMAGIELNLLSLVSLLMVVGLGVDYGIMLVESQGRPAGMRATRFGLLVAAASTVLTFGMLMLSDQPPLFGIGVTASVGVLLCFVVAPTWCAALTNGAQESEL